MGEIDVTKVTAKEYLEKLIEIDNEEYCENDCDTCQYNDTSCANPDKIADIGIENHIEKVMSFILSEPKVNWTKVEKDTLIEVSDDEITWYRRYFAKYNGKVRAYADGCTSKTASATLPWKYARIADED